MIGKEGRVIEDIDNFDETGRIIVDGMEWTARAADEQSITLVRRWSFGRFRALRRW